MLVLWALCVSPSAIATYSDIVGPIEEMTRKLR